MDKKQARLTMFNIKESTKKERKAIIKWLRQIVDEMETLEPEAYVKNPKWTLYK